MKAIRSAAEKANINDPTISEVPNVPRWLTVLRTWSDRITAHFKTSNPDRVRRDASLSKQFVTVQDQLVRVEGSVDGLAGRIDGRTGDRTTIDTLQETIRFQSARMAELESRIASI